MILKISIILILNFIWLNSVSGASFSKVFVHSGAEVVPVDYVQYGVPASSVAGSQLAQISAAPVGSVVPLSAAPNYLAPCGTPCVYPGSSVAAIQAAVPNYVTYKSSVPVVVTSRDEPTGYEYSYVVYDENTGDHKSQREHSDGSVVRGEYSLIQPDGYVREVQYVADDLKGFNAVVKNFLPTNVEKKVEHKEMKDHHGHICHEVKNEPLKHTMQHEETSSEKSKEKSSEGSKEKSSEESKEKSSEESKEKSSEESKEKSSEESSEKSSEHAEKSSKENSHEKPSAALTASESHEAKSEEKNKDGAHKGNAEPLSSEEHSAELSNESKESHEEHKEDSHGHKGSHESHEEPSHEMHKESHEVSIHQARLGNQEPEGNLLVSYNDIIKCVQSAIRKSNDVAAPHQAESALTYIILNKPC